MSEKNPNLVLDVEENPSKISQWILFAVQHVLAMLVACITVPLLTGLPVAATLVSAGIGTIIYLLFTKFKSPVFLSSSFAYLSPMFSALGVGMAAGALDPTMNYMAIIIGMILVGLVYVIIALVIKFVGTAWLNKLLPPIVVGPVIMVIGLSLSSSAISNLTSSAATGESYNLIAILCGLVALFATAFASHYGRDKSGKPNMLALIPFVIGMGAGYLTACVFTWIGLAANNTYLQIVDFEPLTSIFENFSFASIFNYKMFVPNDAESFMFLRLDAIAHFDWTKFGEVALLFVPVALVTICEHVGDHENLGNIIGRDLLNGEPGMQRTLMGDGVATAVSGCLCGAANTTYGENVAVVGTTGIASVKVVLLAAIFAIVIGFFTPFTALLQTIPGCVTGGVSLILYGFIASSGVKMLIADRIDFGYSKNIFIASVILVAGIGGLAIKFGDPDNPTIQITSIAVAMILGIILNIVLKDNKPAAVENEGEHECCHCCCEEKTENAEEPEAK